MGKLSVAQKLKKGIQIVWKCTLHWPVVINKKIKLLHRSYGNPLYLSEKKSWNFTTLLKIQIQDSRTVRTFDRLSFSTPKRVWCVVVRSLRYSSTAPCE